MYEELVQALRHCVFGDCIDCSYLDNCASLNTKAADAIEELNKKLYYQDITVAQILAMYMPLFVPQWIPVTERLPNCNGCYLVWRPHFFGGEVGMPSICYFDGSNTWHDSYGVDFERILHPEDITHWMPLPEPPEKESENLW